MQSPRDFDDIESLIREGSEEVSRRDLNRAVAKYQEAYEMARKSGKHEILVSCACNLGAALLSKGDVEPAIEYLERAFRTLEGEKLRQAENLSGDLSFNLGLAHAMRTDYGAAMRYFSAAAKAFEGCSDWKGFADSCQQLGEQNVKLSKPLKAAECFRDAAKGYLNSGRVFLAVKMVVRQAQNLHEGGNATDSLQLLLKFETLCSKIQLSNTDSGKLAKLFSDAGSLLFQLRSPETASTWLHRALDIVRTRSHSSNLKLEAKILLTLGETCSALGDYTKAVTVNTEASVLYGKLENKKYRGQCFYQLAEAYRHLGDHHNSEKYYHVAYQTLEDAGLHNHLWQVLEGLADLNYQRRQLDTAISYYKDTITQLSNRGAPPSLQHQIFSKLATALEVQRVGVVKAASYKNRIPVLLQPEQDLLMGESIQSNPSDVPLIHSPIYAPLTSTRLSLYSTVDNISASDHGGTRLQVPGKRKKRKSKRRGRRRSGAFDKPVTEGVGDYDTETDISLVKGRMSKRTSKKPSRSHIARQRGAERGDRPAPRRLLSHIQGLEIDEDGSAPPPSRVDDSTQVDPAPPRKRPFVKGLNTASFSDSDPSEVGSERGRSARGRSASQTAITEGDTHSSSSDEDDSLTEVSSDEDATGSSSDDSSDDSEDYYSEEELKFLNESLRSGLNNTYEHPTTSEPLYTTIKSRRLSSGQAEEKLYETLNSTASTVALTSTMPNRDPPAIPSPPEPPRGPRPSQSDIRPPQDEQEPVVSSWEGAKFPDSSVMRTLSRGQREMGLYQVARLVKERQTSQSASSMSSATSEAKVPKSRACIVM